MEILDAYKVLDEYYPQNVLKDLYRTKKYDNSETDTIKKHLYHAELLRGEAKKSHDKEKQSRLNEAADAFEKLYHKEFLNR